MNLRRNVVKHMNMRCNMGKHLNLRRITAGEASYLTLIGKCSDSPNATGNTRFDTQLPLTITNVRGGETISGKLSTPDGTQWTEAHVNLFDEGSGAQTVNANIEINVFPEDKVRAIVTIDGKVRYFDGVLTCQQELQAKRKDSWKWPIWGIWTDVNPYAPMPDVAKDLESLKKAPDKKISYPKGRWLMMDAAKKEAASRYAIVETDGARVLYETGEIWPYPGSAQFVPDVRKVLSADLKTVLEETKPSEYPFSLTYQTATDSILVPAKGRFVRVRSAILLGTWSDAGDFDIPPKGGKTGVPDGIWYEFTRDTSDKPSDKTVAGYSGLYRFTRSFIRNGAISQTDKGLALSMPLAGSEYIRLEEITSVAGDTEKTASMEPESLIVEKFDKSSGTVSLNGKTFTGVGGPSPAGRWCMAGTLTDPPDIAHGSFKVRDRSGKLLTPAAGDQWLEMDKDAKSFTWTQVLEEPSGILVETGKYRTIGGNVLVFSNMRASYAPNPDKPGGTAFQDRINGLGDRLLSFESDKDGTYLLVGHIGRFLPIPAK